MRLISGCLQPTQLSWLPVLSDVAPSLCRKAATDNMLQIIKVHPNALSIHLHGIYKMPLHPKTPSSLASFKSKLVLPFWYRLTQVVLEKRPLNGCNVVVAVLAFTAIQQYFCRFCASFAACEKQGP